MLKRASEIFIEGLLKSRGDLPLKISDVGKGIKLVITYRYCLSVTL